MYTKENILQTFDILNESVKELEKRIEIEDISFFDNSYLFTSLRLNRMYRQLVEDLISNIEVGTNPSSNTKRQSTTTP